MKTRNLALSEDQHERLKKLIKRKGFPSLRAFFSKLDPADTSKEMRAATERFRRLKSEENSSLTPSYRARLVELLGKEDFELALAEPAAFALYDRIYEAKPIGRDQTIKELVRLVLHDPRRKFLLQGGPGLGKTHLAITLIKQPAIATKFQCYFVDLRSEKTLAGMCDKMARFLNVEYQKDTETKKLIYDHLQGVYPQRILIVLDNLEQIPGGIGSLVDGWLEGNEHVVFLGTSRSVDHSWKDPEIPPLPKIDLAGGKSKILASAAVKIFSRRLADIKCDFKLEKDGHWLVAANLCQALDCNPLAIVLAANLMKKWDLPFLVEDISRTVLNAHDDKGTLFDVVKRNLDILTDEAKDLFYRAQIFEDGFTEEAAIAIFGGDESTSKAGRQRIVRENIQELVECNFLLVSFEHPAQGARQTRYRMYRIIHEFAKDRWDRMNNVETRHLKEKLMTAWSGFFFDYADKWNKHIKSPAGEQALDMLALEEQNILKAINSSFELNNEELGLAMFLHFAEYLAVRGPASERRKLLDKCREIKVVTLAKRFELLVYFIRDCWSTGRYKGAAKEVEEVDKFKIFESHYQHDQALIESYGRALVEVGHLRLHQHNAREAEPFITKCVGILERIGCWRGLALANRELAFILDDHGQPQQALDKANSAVDYFRGDADQIEFAVSLNGRGYVEWHTGDWESALRDFNQAEQIFVKHQYHMRLAGSYTNKALALTDGGEFDQAIELTGPAAPIHERISNLSWQAVNWAAKARAMFYKNNRDPKVVKVLIHAIKLSDEAGYGENIALCELIMAQWLVARHRPKDALHLLSHKVRPEQEKIYPHGNHRVCLTLTVMAQAYFALGNSAEAQKFAAEAFELADRLGVNEKNQSLVIRGKYIELIKLRKQLNKNA